MSSKEFESASVCVICGMNNGDELNTAEAPRVAPLLCCLILLWIVLCCLFLLGKIFVEDDAGNDENQANVGGRYDYFAQDCGDEEEGEERGEVAQLVDKGGVVGLAHGESEADEWYSHFECSDVHA